MILPLKAIEWQLKIGYGGLEMMYLKRLTFAPLFWLAWAFACSIGGEVLKEPNLVFSLDSSVFLKILSLALVIVITSILFAIFIGLAQDYLIFGVVIFISAVIPIFFLSSPTSLIISIGGVLIFLFSAILLNNSLKTYLNFRATLLLGPTTKGVGTALTLLIAVGYYQVVSTHIKAEGFQIPDNLIDTALKFSPQAETESISELQPTQKQVQINITAEQLELLKKNPQLLRQNGLDPKILDNYKAPAKVADKQAAGQGQGLVKEIIKAQFSKMIEPYLIYLPGLLGVILFFSLSSFVSILGILVAPMIWLIFAILEKSGFVRFETEMREVKKLVV